MDVEKIEFNDWQIEKMRSALRKYRSLHTSGGCLPSWSKVRDSIAFSDSNLDKYSAEKAELAFKSEALRRFALKINRVLSVERMRDIARFLSDESLFDPENFQEDKGDLANLLALQEFLSKDSGGKKFVFDVFNRPMKYTFPMKPDEKIQKKITLNFTPDSSGKYVRIEEVEQSINLALKMRNDAFRYRKKANENEYTQTKLRKGYGFLVTSLNILHAFLDGNEPGDKMTYIQAGELHENSPDNGIYLMRNGAPTGRSNWEEELYYREPIILPNIYRFIPEKIEGSQCTESEAADGQG
ncbi:hypothetical protein [Pseudomonas sp. Irchel 3A7]|uniref:hypothetical protein n=1 Tax=Pseudomonas sp. Irchel 3A7 TaxID=2008913 RepID=UPI000BA4A04D|nr:hypothetical protein [Pseudomonas sp. Irchel 3A7]